MKSNYDILGNHIRLIDTRNRESITDRVLGINIDKFFMPSVANVIGTDLSKYKLITKGKFACNPMHVGRDERLPVALYDEEKPAIVSPAYFMFEVIDNSILNEDYLMMWFRRPEFDRICWLHTDGSVRGGITWDDICRLELPIPPIENQLEIVNSYKAITERIALKQKINDNLDEQMKALFKSWFIDFEPFNNSLVLTEAGNYIPENWIETTLGEYVTYAQGTQVPVEEQYSELDENRVRFLRIVDYTGNTSDEPRYIEVKSKNSTCCPEDILIIRYGASAGQICRGLSGVFANNLFSITPTKLISNSYLYYLLTQPTVQSFITSVGETSSAMPALTHGLISSIPIVIPQSAKYLNNFAQIADDVFKQQLLNNEEIDVLMSLSKNLLANLSSR